MRHAVGPRARRSDTSAAHEQALADTGGGPLPPSGTVPGHRRAAAPRRRSPGRARDSTRNAGARSSAARARRRSPRLRRATVRRDRVRAGRRRHRRERREVEHVAARERAGGTRSVGDVSVTSRSRATSAVGRIVTRPAAHPPSRAWALASSSDSARYMRPPHSAYTGSPRRARDAQALATAGVVGQPLGVELGIAAREIETVHVRRLASDSGLTRTSAAPAARSRSSFSA